MPQVYIPTDSHARPDDPTDTYARPVDASRPPVQPDPPALEPDPTLPEQLGEGVGGLGGTLVGAALGSIAGPLGAIIGGLAGAFGGWWAGEKVAAAVEEAIEYDHEYRADYSNRPLGGLPYEEMHPAYVVGHAAGGNPEWSDLSWNEVEQLLAESWSYPPIPWAQARPYAYKAFVARKYEAGGR